MYLAGLKDMHIELYCPGTVKFNCMLTTSLKQLYMQLDMTYPVKCDLTLPRRGSGSECPAGRWRRYYSVLLSKEMYCITFRAFFCMENIAKFRNLQGCLRSFCRIQFHILIATGYGSGII